MTSIKASWQEVEIKVNNLKEIDIPGFWEFLETAVNSFQNKKKAEPIDMSALTPWAKLGKKWHLMRKGFAADADVAWTPEVLEALEETLSEAAPGSEFEWGNEQVVHVVLPDRKQPWASIHTKQSDGLWLNVPVPKGEVEAATVTGLAGEADVTSENESDMVRLGFLEVDQANGSDLKEFLSERAAAAE